MKKGFSNELYIKEQAKYIKERVKNFNKLYLEFGGKLFSDLHASRVLPGYDPDVKTRLLEELKDKIEVIIAIRAKDIATNKLNHNSGKSYEGECLNLIKKLRDKSIEVSSVAINRYIEDENVDRFIKVLEQNSLKVYKFLDVKGFPNDVDTILSADGFGKNPYIKTEKPIVIVTAPGPGSGKMATALSQLYHENLNGISAGYAKFETFPVWNLDLKHEVNLAYEAATADLKDQNQIDPYHLSNYGIVAVNYNRDIESFVILKRILDNVLGKELYKSPTDMGVNKITSGIIDEKVVREAARNEIIRRYLIELVSSKSKGKNTEELDTLRRLMDELSLKVEDRKVLRFSREKLADLKQKTNFIGDVTAIETGDGFIITGKDSKLMNSESAAVLNVLKYLAKLPDDLHLIDPNVLKPILDMKKNIEKDEEIQLNLEEVLVSLAASNLYNPGAKKCLDLLPELNGLRAHKTGMLTKIDQELLKKLNIDITCEYKEHSIN